MSEDAARRFADLVGAGGLDVPPPGRGGTERRWRLLAELAADDLDVARLAEAHLDALAILDDLSGSTRRQTPALPVTGSRWAVWAAEPPNGRVEAALGVDGRWRLSGTKRWCSGAHCCTHALVTAHADGASRLFAVDLSEPGVRAGRGGWAGLGMVGSGTEDVDLDAVPAVAVGGPRGYLDRVGFWLGAIGVAACWYGGAVGVAGPLCSAARAGALDSHARAHLGAIDSALAAASAMLREAARCADLAGDPAAGDASNVAHWHRRALQVRAVVEAAAGTTVERVGRALGPRPLATDAAHSRRIADLTVYVRQSHAERDLAALGDLAAAADRWQPW